MNVIAEDFNSPEGRIVSLYLERHRKKSEAGPYVPVVTVAVVVEFAWVIIPAPAQWPWYINVR